MRVHDFHPCTMSSCRTLPISRHKAKAPLLIESFGSRKKNLAVCETGSYVIMRTSGRELCTVIVGKERTDVRLCVK